MQVQKCGELGFLKRTVLVSKQSDLLDFEIED